MRRACKLLISVVKKDVAPYVLGSINLRKDFTNLHTNSWSSTELSAKRAVCGFPTLRYKRCGLTLVHFFRQTWLALVERSRRRQRSRGSYFQASWTECLFGVVTIRVSPRE